MSERILVTGGAGFIGSNLARYFLQQGHQVAVLDDLSTGNPEVVPQGVTMYFGDIRWAAQVRSICHCFKPTVVCHHAAQSTVKGGARNPLGTYDTNIMGTANVLQAAAECGTRRVIFASSGAIYGDCDGAECETDFWRPLSAYALSKLMGEELLRFAEARQGIEVVIFRYGNVYGPGQNPHGEAGVIAVFAGKMLRGEPVTIFGDGLQTRDYIHVRDVCRANLLAVDGPPGTYNIATGVSTSLVNLFRELCGRTHCYLPPRGAPVTPGDARNVRLDVSRAKACLRFRYATDLAQGLAETVEYLRNNGDQ